MTNFKALYVCYKTGFTGSSFIDVNPFDRVRMAHLIPQMFKFHNTFDFIRPGGAPKITGV